SCHVTDGQPRCVHDPPSCDDLHCPKGSTCQVINSWPKCVQTQTSVRRPSCSDLHCPQGTSCHMTNGQPRCVHDPPSCDDVQCPKDSTCHVVSGHPRCV
ncbi:SP51 protein, partial [Cephalopterus ornatus]|nr:SP51 protein [Cephalopterus ornatus]